MGPVKFGVKRNPWMIVKVGDDYCVYKQGADKQPVGEALDCHDTEEKAKAHLAALYASEPGLSNPERCIRAATPITLEDAVEGVVRGYIFIWGDGEHRDAYDTYFDKTRPPELDLDLLPIALRYEHGEDGTVNQDRVGEIRDVGFDEEGCWFLGYLNRDGPYFERVVNEIQYGTANGPLRTSSGTINYLADFYEDGAFKYWPVNEVSLTAFAAETRMPDVVLVRSETGREAPEQNPETAVETQEQTDESAGGIDNPLPNEQLQEHTIMIEQIMEILQGLPEDADLTAFMAALLESGLFTQADLQEAVGMLGSPESEEEEALSERTENPLEIFAQALATVMDARAEVEAVEEARSIRAQNRQLNAQVALLQQQTRMAAPPPPAKTTGDQTDGGRITGMEDLRYAHLSGKEMAFGFQLLASRGKAISEDYRRALLHKAMEHIAQGPSQFREPSNYRAARSAVPKRADEIMGIGQSLKGLDWVGDYWEATIWEVVRAARIMSAVEAAGLWIIEVPDGSNDAKVPLEGSDPIWYSAAENASVGASGRAEPLVDPSQVATAKVTVTPGKAMARVLVTTELIEDSIVPTLAQINRQFEESAANAIEYLFINADSVTTENANINLIDSTPASGTNAPLYLVTNGVLKYALVTGSSTSRDGGALTSADFLATRKLMPDANAADPVKLVYLSDVDTYLKSLEMADVKTKDVFQGATIENGVLAGVWGSAYLASAQMAKAYTAGKISATSGNNTKGRLACVYAPYMAMVWKRKVTYKTEEDIEADVTKMVASLRVAFQARGAGASTVTYNLTV